MNMHKVVCTGGSITAGTGWNLENESDLYGPWVLQLQTNINEFKNLEILNLGEAAASNEKIFLNTVKAFSEYGSDIKYLLCSWVSGPRYQYHLGFELYDTSDSHQDRSNDLGLNNFKIPKEYINNIKKRFFSLHHIHYEIVKIVKYSNIISNLSKQFKTKVFHINDSCPWDKDFFIKKDGLPSNYTKFTQDQILNVSTRCDEEIFKLYNKMHQDYNNEGSVSTKQWVNLYNSFLSLQTDTNHDNQHPGHKSTQTYSRVIKEFLNKQGIY